jgi:hypothetical protein
MKKNILVFIPTGLTSPEVEVLISCTQNLLDKKNLVTILVCKGGQNYSCARNIMSLNSICNLCKIKRNKFVSKLKGNFKVITTPLIEKNKLQIVIKKFQDLKEYRYKGFDNGLATYASYLDNSRDKDLQGFFAQEIIKRNLNVTNTLSDFYLKILKDLNIHEVFAFNSRMNIYRPLLRSSVNLGIKYNNLESAYYRRSLKVFNLKNSEVADFKKLPKLINTYWKKKNNFSKDKIVKNYFINIVKFMKPVEIPKSYLTEQKYGLLPNKFDKKKYNITFYVSSEDEDETFEKQNTFPIFKNQKDCILKICEIISLREDFFLWIRVHPNLKNVNWPYVKDILNIQGMFKNVFVIKPNSPISSHALMKSSNLILGLGSRALLESTYIKKPTILLGEAYWTKLGQFNEVNSLKELKNKILSKNVRILNNLASKKYAYFWTTYGKKLKYLSGHYFWNKNKTKADRYYKFNKKLINFSKIEKAEYILYKIIEKILLYINYKFY